MFALLGLLPLLLLGRYSRIVYATVLPLGLVLVSLEWFVRANFDMILTGSWVGMFFASSPDELRWFFRHYLTIESCLGIAGVLLACACLAFCSRCVRKASASRTTIALALFVCVFSVAMNRLPKASFTNKFGSFPGLALIPDSIERFSRQRRLARMMNSPQLPQALRLAQNNGQAPVGVFVLGESATRNRWSLYGYPRPTTPEMDSIRSELVVFGDLLTTASMTCDAMRALFTTQKLEDRNDLRFSMTQVLKKCGVRAALYSKHGRWDSWSSDETFSFAGCDSFVCMNEQGETNRLDGVVLKYLQRSLDAAKGNEVVFLHLFGSHMDFTNYPRSEAPFGSDDGKGDVMQAVAPSDRYDNTIWYTDKILGEVVRKLKALHKPMWMIYVSDHGETPSSKRWRTATDNDLWEIPFVVWTSPEFDAAYPERVAALRRAKDKPLQSDQLLYGLLRFMGVEGLGNAPEEDFLSDSFKPRTPRLILGGSAAYEPVE